MEPSITDLKQRLNELLSSPENTDKEVAKAEQLIISIKNKEKEKTMSNNIFKTFGELLDFIEIHKITDETFHADDGRHEVRSKHFSYLIDKARENLRELTQLPCPPSTNAD